MKNILKLSISLILPHMVFAMEDTEKTLSQKNAQLQKDITGIESLLEKNKSLESKTFKETKDFFADDEEIRTTLNSITIKNENTELAEVLNQKRQEKENIENSSNEDYAQFFSVNFFENGKENESAIVRNHLERGNLDNFLAEQEKLNLKLNSSNFQNDRRVEWLITKLGRTYNQEDPQEQLTLLKELIDNDGIRKLGYESIEELDNGIQGSQNEAKAQEAGTKLEHEASRVGDQFKNAGKDVGNFFKKI